MRATGTIADLRSEIALHIIFEWQMRILHVITTINRGGAENHLVDLAIGQAARGINVTVAFLKGDHYWATRLRAAGVRVEPLELTRYGAFAPIICLRRLILELAPDLIHAHMPPAELYTRLALLGHDLSPPLVVTKHNDEPFYRGLGHRTLGRWAGRRTMCVIVISDAIRRYMRNQMGLPDDRMRTIHYGVDCQPFEAVDNQTRQQLRTEWGVAEGDMVIGTIARLVPQKALHFLVLSFARYRAIGRRRARLVVVGHGPLLKGLKEMALRLDLCDAVVWAGFREDIPSLMHAFDVFSLSSAYEGFGLVLLEAMAAKRPIVATAVSAIPEIVQDGITGLLCRPGDTKAMTQAFLTLEDPELCTRLGQNGLVRAREYFTLDRMIDATLAVYRECLA